MIYSVQLNRFRSYWSLDRKRAESFAKLFNLEVKQSVKYPETIISIEI